MIINIGELVNNKIKKLEESKKIDCEAVVIKKKPLTKATKINTLNQI